jgi:hypothetical protein
MLRDLIYFDFDKAASVWSQLTSIGEGSGADATRAERNRRIRAGVERAAANTIAIDAEERSIIESALLHRDLLDGIEEDLTGMGYVADLNGMVDPEESSGAAIREAIGENPYVKAEGWASFEDFQRILSIVDHFNEIIEFIGKAEIQSVRNTEGYQELQRALEDAKAAINMQADRNQKAIAKTKLQNAERQIAEMLRPGINPIEAWLLDGVQKWIGMFMPNRINLRVYPFANCPKFQVICNMKRECFLDQDLEHLLYGYGNRPNLPLTVLGLITSAPPEGPHPFDPMTEFEGMVETSDKIIFEKIFRSLFNVMGEIESFVKFTRYPNVTVHPLAVFRQLRGSRGG